MCNVEVNAQFLSLIWKELAKGIPNTKFFSISSTFGNILFFKNNNTLFEPQQIGVFFKTTMTAETNELFNHTYKLDMEHSATYRKVPNLHNCPLYLATYRSTWLPGKPVRVCPYSAGPQPTGRRQTVVVTSCDATPAINFRNRRGHCGILIRNHPPAR